MADITVATVTAAGVEDPTLAAASAGGDTFTNDGRTLLKVDNAGGGACEVTINSRVNCDQGFDHDIVVSVPAGETHLIGPFPKGRFNDETTGKVSVAYDQVTSVTVGAISTP